VQGQPIGRTVRADPLSRPATGPVTLGATARSGRGPQASQPHGPWRQGQGWTAPRPVGERSKSPPGPHSLQARRPA